MSTTRITIDLDDPESLPEGKRRLRGAGRHHGGGYCLTAAGG